MQKLKKLIAMILVTVLLVTALPSVSVFAFRPSYRPVYDDQMLYGKKLLDSRPNHDELISLYNLLVEGCGDFEEVITVPDMLDISVEELNFVYQMFYADHPEYFWIRNGKPGYSLYTYMEHSKVSAVSPIYEEYFKELGTPDADKIEAAEEEYEEKIDELTADLSSKSDYEKAKILHDRLCDITTYIYGNNNQNSYGALIEGEAVCNGYARAYQHLLEEVGIEVWYVNGDSYMPGSTTLISHAWNIVKLNGEWYYTDVTWDDQGDYTFYTYFNITREQLNEGHIIDQSIESYLPSATSDAENYYVKENLIFEEYDENRLIDVLSNDNHSAQIYISGDLNEFLNNLSFDVFAALGVTNSDDIKLVILGNTLYIRYSLCDHDYEWFQDSLPTCVSNGWKIEKCTICKQTRGDWVPVYDPDAHLYDNDCDTHCNRCHQSRGIEHRYGNDNTCDICSFTLYDISKLFPDTANNAWYSAPVTYVVGSNLMKGYQNGKFGISDGIQRQDFLVMLSRFDGVDLSQYEYDCAMPDVGRESYYEAAVNWGVQNGITTGYANGKFGVGDMITREQIVTFLYRYAAYKGLNRDVSELSKINIEAQYYDFGKVSDFAEEAVYWAITYGVIGGKENNTAVVPQGNAQRCEIAQIMYNIYLNDTF